MSVLITSSKTPLMMETLPAVKLVHCYGNGRDGHVYAYLRMYVLNGAFCFNLTQFLQCPAADTRMALCLGMADSEAYISVVCPADGNAAVQQYNAADESTGTLGEVPLRHFAGTDEQGWYWSVEGTLTAEACRAAFGRVPDAGSVWAGNVYAYNETESAFAAAFATPAGSRIPTKNGFSVFTVVPY